MKYLKTVGLAAVAAAAIMALGAGSASAATVICANTGTTPEGSNPCNVGSHVKEYSGAIVAATTAGEANQAKLVTSLGTVRCDSSSTITPASSTGSPTITGTASVSFTNCLRNGSEKCTVTMSAKEYTGHTEGTVGGATNAFKVVVTGASAHVVCGSFIDCWFGKPEITLDGRNGEPTNVSTNEVELNREGGFFCPSTSFWTAKYDVTSPTGGVTVH
jgi:hypothetical protein